MNDYTDWDASLVDYSDDILGMSKAQWREKLKEDTQTYLDNGGEITYLPYDPVPEILARVGRWQAQGRDELDDLTTETKVY